MQLIKNGHFHKKKHIQVLQGTTGEFGPPVSKPCVAMTKLC